MRVHAIDITGRATRAAARGGSGGQPPATGRQSARTPGTCESAPHATLRITLGRDAHAPSRARHAVAGFSAGADMSASSLATIKLLVSELVSNAVLHSDAPAASEIELRACLLGDDAVRVEVSDAGSGFNAKPRDRAREGGYGLLLVGSQASSWGIDRREHSGTCVWFELADSRARMHATSV
jgi:anti-sigma regulatory factor (Ser/Thr protein kinase)